MAEVTPIAERAAGMPLLLLEDLHVHFASPQGPVHAVRGIDLALGSGERLGLVGESGSGKSALGLTLLRLHGPQTKVQAARLQVAQHDLLSLSETEMCRLRGRTLAMVFQDPMTALNPYLTIGTQLEEVLWVHTDLPRRARKTRTAALLARVGFNDPMAARTAYPHQFSGGMRQRVVLAMALLCEPQLLIADEPTTALDVTVQAQVLGLLRDEVQRLASALIFISHDLAVVASMCTQIRVMYAGRVVEAAPTSALLQRAQHPYTQGLLASVLTLQPAGTTRGRALVSIPGRPPSPHALPAGCAFAPRCPRALPRCHAEVPTLSAPDGQGRQVACWNLGPAHFRQPLAVSSVASAAGATHG